MGINTLRIDEILEMLALSNEKRFNAYQVASLAKESDPVAVNDYLLYKSDGNYGTLIAKIETLCDNNHPDMHFNMNEKLPEYEIECRICGEEYLPDLDFSHLVFYCRDSFIKDAKKKTMMNSSCQLVSI